MKRRYNHRACIGGAHGAISGKFISSLATESGYSENTLAAYRNDLSQFIKFVRERRGSAADLVDLTPELVAAYVDNLQQAPNQYALSTVARRLRRLSPFSTIWRIAISFLRPGGQTDRPKVKKHVPQTLSRAEIEKLLNAPGRNDNPKDLRDHALLSMLCMTGMRVTEIVSLQVKIWIGKQPGDLPGKSGRQRKIPMAWQWKRSVSICARRGPTGQTASPSVFFLNQRGQNLPARAFG